MKVKFKLLVVLLITSWGITLNAQDCKRVESKCPKPDKSYTVSSKSRSIKMRKGRKTRIVLNVYRGRDYFFSTYSKPKVGDLQFKIVSASTNQVLYDNAAEGMVDNKKITASLSQKLYIELVVPNWTSNKDYECAAFLIAYKN